MDPINVLAYLKKTVYTISSYWYKDNVCCKIKQSG